MQTHRSTTVRPFRPACAHRLRRRLIGLALVPALALGVAACSTEVTPPAASVPTEQAPTEQAPTADATTSVAARPKASSLAVHAAPDAASPVVQTFGRNNALGSRTTLLVTAEQGDFVQVSLPTRPNGSTGWVKADDVELRSTQLAITVDRASHHLTVTNGGEQAIETSVAIGTTENPTPAGNFYVTDLVQTDDANGAYGPFALGLSGHSETLSEFGGGDGQLAIHGTNDSSSIGNSVSHGCVRVPNDVVNQLAKVIPLGAPVTVI